METTPFLKAIEKWAIPSGFMELSRSQKPLKYNLKSSGLYRAKKSESKGRYDISYINIPVMLKWTEGRFYSELGPELGILTINTSKDVPDDIRLANFETFDFSMNVGAGYEVFEDWTIGLRYIQGLTNIVEGQDLKNSVIYLGVAYSLF